MKRLSISEVGLKDSTRDIHNKDHRINYRKRGGGVLCGSSPSTSNKLKERNIMREDYSITKTRHAVKAKDALIVYKMRWFCYQQQKKIQLSKLS